MTEYGIIIEKYLKYISKSNHKVEIIKKKYFLIFKPIIIPFKFNLIYVLKKYYLKTYLSLIFFLLFSA